MPKVLREFLHEQQEPFSLELYLLERGYNSAKASRFTRKKERNNVVSSYTEFFKSVINRLVPVKKERNNIESNHSRYIHDQEESREQHAYEEEDEEEFSTAFESCAVNHYDVFSAKNVDAAMEEDKSITKQLSPVSVLEETESSSEEEDSPLHQKTNNFKTFTAQGESSASMPKRLLLTIAASKSAASRDHQYAINKRILHESKKLLIDTVREVIEIQRRKDERSEQLKRIMGPDELWKLVCENLRIWSWDSIDEANVAQLLRCDFLGSEKDWRNDYEMHREAVCDHVGDGILQEIILEVFRG